MDKSVFFIDETTELLSSFINKISYFNSKKIKLEDELKIFNVNDLERKQHDLLKVNNDKQDLENRIHNFEVEISESETKIPDIIRDIEKKLRYISSTKYTINQ